MIYLKTGLPGAGKTLSMVERGAALAKEGRRVFYEGIEEVDEAKLGIRRFPAELQDWAEALETGDVLLVDEITRYPELKKGGTRTQLPAWVERLTRNRHYGIDLYFCTQDPKNADTFVRRLVNHHEHFVNKFGADESVVYAWPECVDDIEMRSNRERADKKTYKYPKELYGTYKSATLHTRKKYTPRKLKFAYAAFAVAILCVLVAVVAVSRFTKGPSAARSAAPAKLATVDTDADTGGVFGSSRGKHKMTREEWLSQMVPRMPGFMWSEPIFDDRKAEAQPETYCMAVEDGPCRCISEQGTRIKMDQETCRAVALDGIYNPYKHPITGVQHAQDQRPQQRPETPTQRPADLSEPTEKGSSKGHKPLTAPYDTEQFAPRTTQY